VIFFLEIDVWTLEEATKTECLTCQESDTSFAYGSGPRNFSVGSLLPLGIGKRPAMLCTLHTAHCTLRIYSGFFFRCPCAVCTQQHSRENGDARTWPLCRVHLCVKLPRSHAVLPPADSSVLPVELAVGWVHALSQGTTPPYHTTLTKGRHRYGTWRAGGLERN
jgi:hypothetical protein